MTETAVTYTFREFYIPARMMPGIRRYIENGILPGKFLQAVISNNLHDALSQADDENLRNLQAFVGYFYNEAPSPCWGSPEKMHKWIEDRKEIAERVALHKLYEGAESEVT